MAQAPELADLRGDGDPTPIEHHVPDMPGLDAHVRLLRQAGFAEVGPVWQHGANRVLVALR